MKKTVKIALWTIGLAVLFFVFVPQVYVRSDNYLVRHQGEVLAKRIDAFELKEGHVPETLQEIGEKYPNNTGRLSYFASGPHHYTISYMDWASATLVFDSNSRKWEFRRS